MSTSKRSGVEPLVLRGSLIVLRRRCGKPGCHCATGEPHATPALSYSVEGKHFFGAHRDNGAPTTADRAFAVSLNLNDDFEGGELVFPEYAGLKVSPPTGAAAVFSCSLLHRALTKLREAVDA